MITYLALFLVFTLKQLKFQHPVLLVLFSLSDALMQNPYLNTTQFKHLGLNWTQLQMKIFKKTTEKTKPLGQCTCLLRLSRFSVISSISFWSFDNCSVVSFSWQDCLSLLVWTLTMADGKWFTGFCRSTDTDTGVLNKSMLVVKALDIYNKFHVWWTFE